jgi:hypothetical protein
MKRVSEIGDNKVMWPVHTDVFTVFVRVLVVCESLPSKHYCCVCETAISIGNWLAVDTHMVALM